MKINTSCITSRLILAFDLFCMGSIVLIAIGIIVCTVYLLAMDPNTRIALGLLVAVYGIGLVVHHGFCLWVKKLWF